VLATTLGRVDPASVDMSTILLTGSSTTESFTDPNGRQWIYTPRHYPGTAHPAATSTSPPCPD
jgi:cobalt-precorrin 5A hydrolase / precorrin-3B C17-methyltransferase